MINNQRRLHMLPAEQRGQLSSGTTSVEALNAELNNRFRFYGAFYQSTLLLTIRAFGETKLLTHNIAEYNPTLRQVSQRAVAVHSMAAFRLSDAEWHSVAGTDCVEVRRRLRHKTAIRAASEKAKAGGLRARCLLLPGVSKRPASAVKRHTFNKRRLPHLLRRPGAASSSAALPSC